jgi:hypothetical protein
MWPPSEIQMPVTATRPRDSRAAFTGCSCSSICISLNQRRHRLESLPSGSHGKIAPRTADNGVVLKSGGRSSNRNQASGRGA